MPEEEPWPDPRLTLGTTRRKAPKAPLEHDIGDVQGSLSKRYNAV